MHSLTLYLVVGLLYGPYCDYHLPVEFQVEHLQCSLQVFQPLQL